MFTSLISLGLVAVTFAIMPNMDIREMKFYVAIVFALALGLLECKYHGFKKVKNGALLLLLMYFCISQIIAPNAAVQLSGVSLNKFWSWEPIFKISMMFFLYMAVMSHDFTEKNLKIVLDVMIWCGTLTGIYVIFQAINLDQFFVCKFGDNANVAGFIGNPTQCAPFIAMLAPVAIFRKKYIHLAIMVLSVIVIRSAFGYLGLAIAVLSYFSILNFRFFIWSLIILSAWMLVILVISTNHIPLHNRILEEAFIFNDSSRFEHWSQITKDIVSDLDKNVGQKCPLTGRGLGSFKIVYHAQHGNNYVQAHNEYLELAYSSGIIGLMIFLCAIWSMFKRNLSKEKLFRTGTPRYRATLMAGIICILVVSCGTFILQVGTTSFFVVVMCGLLENQSELIL